jgi:putative transposase
MQPLMQTNIRQQSTAIPAGWLGLDRVESILGKSRRAVQLACQQGALRAEIHQGQYWVDPECHPALRIATGRVEPAPAAAGSALAAMPQQRRAAMFGTHQRIEAYLRDLQDKPADMSVAEHMGLFVDLWNAAHADRRVSVRTMYRQLAAYRQGGIESLADSRGGARNGSEFDPLAQQFILGLYARESHLSLNRIYQLAQMEASRRDWQLPALRTVQRWMQKRVGAKALAAGQDPKAFHNRMVPHISRDWSQVAAMELWIADHRQLDVMVPRWITDAKGRRAVKFYRPWLTMWIDARSWMPVGWIMDFDAPDSNRVFAAFIQAVMRYGVPANVMLDNGKDFRSQEFAGGRSWKKNFEMRDGRVRRIGRDELLIDDKTITPLLATLGITAHWAMPYNARAKIIENWFGLMSRQFDRTWSTWCGNKPERRPEVMKKLKAELAADKIDLPGIRAAFDRWVMDDYALGKCPSSACEGYSPMRALAELRGDKYATVRPSDQALALLLGRWHKRIRIEASGLWVHAFGDHYWCDGNDEFERRRAASGNDVALHVTYRYMPNDPSVVWAFDFITDRFLFALSPVGRCHPLADDEDQRAMLAGQIAKQRRLERDTRAFVREHSRVATNILLESHEQAAGAAGLLDDPRTIHQPQPAIKLLEAGEIDRAATAGQIEAGRQRRRERFEAMTASLRKTGTADALAIPQHDDLAQAASASTSALDLMTDHYMRSQRNDPTENIRTGDSAGGNDPT